MVPRVAVAVSRRCVDAGAWLSSLLLIWEARSWWCLADKWTTSVLGVKGEKAEPEMVKILASKGPKGLAKMLLKRYRAEHK